MIKNDILNRRALIIFFVSFFLQSAYSQSNFEGAILDKSCSKIFKKYLKPGHVLNFESPEAALDGKFMLLMKKKSLHFVEADATPRSSSKLSLKTIANQDLVAVRDEQGQLIAKLKFEKDPKTKKYNVSCQ